MTAEAAPLNAGAPAHAAPLLDVEGLSVEIKVPGGMLHAVTDVSFSVAPGETLKVVLLATVVGRLISCVPC